MKRTNRSLFQRRNIISSALTAAVLAILIVPGSASAKVKAKIRVNLPSIDLILKSGGYNFGHSHGALQLRPARRHFVRLDLDDRRIAKALARRTDYSKRDLLRLRQAGYNWRQIGRMLDLPARMVKRVVRQVRLDDLRFERSHRKVVRGGILLPGGCSR